MQTIKDWWRDAEGRNQDIQFFSIFGIGLTVTVLTVLCLLSNQ